MIKEYIPYIPSVFLIGIVLKMVADNGKRFVNKDVCHTAMRGIEKEIKNLDEDIKIVQRDVKEILRLNGK